MTAIGGAVGPAPLPVAHANIRRRRTEQKSIKVISLGGDAMRPGVIRANGDATRSAFPDIQKQTIIFRAAHTLIFGEGPDQLSGPLRVNQRQDSPAIG